MRYDPFDQRNYRYASLMLGFEVGRRAASPFDYPNWWLNKPRSEDAQRMIFLDYVPVAWA